jgi:alanyl-tRNA synthetase
VLLLLLLLQGKMSNYATDLFGPIFDEIQRVTGARTYTDKVREAAAQPIVLKHWVWQREAHDSVQLLTDRMQRAAHDRCLKTLGLAVCSS